MNQEVKVTCYGVTKTFENVETARETFTTAMIHSEGAESERYLNIVTQLDDGLTVCSDEMQLTERRK